MTTKIEKGFPCLDFAQLLKQQIPTETLIETLAHCFSKQILTYAQYRCKNNTVAHDAAQDAMIIALNNIKSFRGDASIEVWLKKLVTSACSRLKRGKKNNPKNHEFFNEQGDREDSIDHPDRDQEFVLLIKEQIEKISLILEKIDEPNRSIFLLHEGQDIPLKDIATQLDMTIDAVKSRLKRIRLIIREGIEKV